MKRLLTFLFLLLLVFSAKSQNGGQSGENESVRVQTGAVTSNWEQVIIVTNKQTCTVDIKFEHNDRTVIKRFPALGSDTFHIRLPNCSIRVKPLDNCGGANMGWLEFNVCAALPLKFEYIRVRKISGTLHEIEFKVQNSDNEKQFNVQVSKDGINYKNVHVILSQPIQTDKIYKVRINL